MNASQASIAAIILLMTTVAFSNTGVPDESSGGSGAAGITLENPDAARRAPVYLAVARRFVRFAGAAVKNAREGSAVVIRKQGRTLTLKYTEGDEVTVEVQEPDAVAVGDKVIVREDGLAVEKRRRPRVKQ